MIVIPYKVVPVVNIAKQMSLLCPCIDGCCCYFHHSDHLTVVPKLSWFEVLDESKPFTKFYVDTDSKSPQFSPYHGCQSTEDI